MEHSPPFPLRDWPSKRKVRMGSREAQIVIRKGRGGGRGKTEERLEGHEGERQIKFDRKLHEIVGEPRWSAPVRQPMPTRLFLATDYHRSSPRTRGPRNEGAPRPWPPRPTDPTTSHVPDARNAPFPSERIGPITLFGAKPHTRVSIEREQSVRTGE